MSLLNLFYPECSIYLLLFPLQILLILKAHFTCPFSTVSPSGWQGSNHTDSCPDLSTQCCSLHLPARPRWAPGISGLIQCVFLSSTQAEVCKVDPLHDYWPERWWDQKEEQQTLFFLGGAGGGGCSLADKMNQRQQNIWGLLRVCFPSQQVTALRHLDVYHNHCFSSQQLNENFSWSLSLNALMKWPFLTTHRQQPLRGTHSDSSWLILAHHEFGWLNEYSNATLLKQVKHLCLTEVSICPNGKAPVLFSLAQHSPQTTIAPSSMASPMAPNPHPWGLLSWVSHGTPPHSSPWLSFANPAQQGRAYSTALPLIPSVALGRSGWRSDRHCTKGAEHPSGHLGHPLP